VYNAAVAAAASRPIVAGSAASVGMLSDMGRDPEERPRSLAHVMQLI
jgi:hypothetical protein